MQIKNAENRSLSKSEGKKHVKGEKREAEGWTGGSSFHILTLQGEIQISRTHLDRILFLFKYDSFPSQQ